MRLIYEDTGEEVKTGDNILMKDGSCWIVDFFREPHKPSSSGKVYILPAGEIDGLRMAGGREFYVSVIGAKWIEREDR